MGATGSSPIMDMRDVGFLIILFWCWVITLVVVTPVSLNRSAHLSKKPGHTPPTGAAWVLRDILYPSLLVVFIAGIVYVVVDPLGDTLAPAILLALILLAACCYMVGSILYDRQTIEVPSGRRYPKYEILSYLTPEQKARIKNYDWYRVPTDRSGETELRGRRLDRDPKTEPPYCPLGAVLSNGKQIPMPDATRVAATLRPVDYGNVMNTVSSYRTVFTAARQFIEDNDSGRIDPADVIDIFTAPL